MSYKGRYTVVYRSLWERQAFKWCENNPKVKMWNSEEVVVPYKSTVDKKLHRYFVDLLIQMEDKTTYLVEIKPKKETKPPKKPKRKSKRYINEQLTFIKNQDKWEAASEFADYKGWKFQVWTEETLKNLGIKIL